MIVFSKQVAVAIKKAIPCNRVGMMVLGLEVPHAHIHLVPIQSESDLDISKARLKISEEEFKEIVALIRKELE